MKEGRGGETDGKGNGRERERRNVEQDKEESDEKQIGWRDV